MASDLSYDIFIDEPRAKQKRLAEDASVPPFEDDRPLVDDFGAFGDRKPDDAADLEQETTSYPPATLDEWDAGDDLGLPPPRGWLLGNQFCRGFLSGLLAPGATGKSAVRLVQFMARPDVLFPGNMFSSARACCW